MASLLTTKYMEVENDRHNHLCLSAHIHIHLHTHTHTLSQARQWNDAVLVIKHLSQPLAAAMTARLILKKLGNAKSHQLEPELDNVK